MCVYIDIKGKEKILKLLFMILFGKPTQKFDNVQFNNCKNYDFFNVLEKFTKNKNYCY